MKEKLYRIEEPRTPSNWRQDSLKLSDKQKKEFIDISENPVYLYWDKMKYKISKDLPISRESVWSFIANHRQESCRQIPVYDEEGSPHHYCFLQRWEGIIQQFDKFFLNKPRDIVHQSEPWMVEAISSAMIEGAHTTRNRALQLLKLKKTPADYSERMILNNYKMARVLENLPLDFQMELETLFDWQIQLTHQNLPEADQARLRKNEDKIVIAPTDQDIITFVPPSEEFLIQEIDKLIDFVNKPNPTLHPLIQAICIHYWFAYLHPFVDGNGRTARSLFYWFLIKSGYPNVTSLPLSPLILKSLQHYSKAFVYTEQDHHDMTYFIDYNIRLIEGALVQFKSYETIDHSQESQDERLNLRQNVIIHILKSKQLPDVNVSYVQNKFGVSKLTAINDLKTLVSLKIVESRRVGKNVLYQLKK